MPVGIPAEALESIFEAFKQQEGQETKKYGGTGLGLAITRKLIGMMNGTIQVESTRGQGSVFRVCFQGIEIFVGEAKPTPTELDMEQVKFEPAQVLIVDDVAMNRELLVAMFSTQPFEILQAENGLEAVHLAKQHLPSLILMDIRMPVMDGFEAIRQLRQFPQTQDIPVIALTASVMQHELSKLEESGFDTYLQKPIQLEKIYGGLMAFLPYELVQLVQLVQPVVVLKAKTGPLTPAQVEGLSDLIGQLEQGLMELYQVLLKNKRLNMLNQFSQRLQGLLETYPFSPLAQFSENFKHSIDNFNDAEIDANLRKFPLMIAELRALQTQSEAG